MKFLILLMLFLSQSFASPLIIGGENVDQEPLIEKSTVSILSRFNGVLSSFCSGTVIHRSLVVTAAHCLANRETDELYISFGKDVRHGQLYEVEKFKYFFAGYYDQITQQNLLEGRDIALLITKEELPLRVVEIGYPVELLKQKEVIQAGYGLIRERSSDHTGTDFSALGYLFMLSNNTFSRLVDRAVEVGENIAHKVAGGDSGGPLYVKEENRLHLHGVLSQSGATTIIDDGGGTTIDNYRAYYTHPYYFLDWMNCSLPDSLKIHSSYELKDQVACDGQPFLSISLLTHFNKKLCENQRPGFIFTESYGCWPATQEACRLYSDEVSMKLEWDQTQNECLIKD